jgi:hypothetical protein
MASILLSFNIQAKSSFLTPEEFSKVSNFLDNICMDTFCGGEFNWTDAHVSCEKNMCTFKMNVMGWSVGELDITTKEFNNLPIEKRKSQNVELTSAQTEISDLYTDSFEGTQISTKCVFDLKPSDFSISYNQKEDLVYMKTLDCVSDLEHLLWEL